MDVPTLDKVLEVFAPLDSCFRLVLQFWNWLSHDICQQVDQTCTRLHLSAVGREGEAMLRYLEEGDSSAPNVRCDGVRLSRDPLRGHVVRCTDKCICVAFGSELAADAEIAQLDFAISTQEDVAGFDVSMDDLFAVEIGQAIQDPLGNLSQDLLARPAAEFLNFSVDRVERPPLAELHGDADGRRRRLHEGAIVSADVITGTGLVET